MSALICVIVGCCSTFDNKFVKFPSPNDPQYGAWMDACYRSAEEIRKHDQPYICSKHFKAKLVGSQRLTEAVPSLYLYNRLYVPDKSRIEKLINETVREWCSRVHYISYSMSDIICVAMKVQRLLGLRIGNPNLDSAWFQKFRLNYLNPFPSSKVGRTTDLKRILRELDPHVRICPIKSKAEPLNSDNFVQSGHQRGLDSNIETSAVGKDGVNKIKVYSKNRNTKDFMKQIPFVDSNLETRAVTESETRNKDNKSSFDDPLMNVMTEVMTDDLKNLDFTSKCINIEDDKIENYDNFDLEKEYSELCPIEGSTSTKISRDHDDNSIFEIAFKHAGIKNKNIKREDHLQQTHTVKALGRDVINTALGQNVTMQRNMAEAMTEDLNKLDFTSTCIKIEEDKIDNNDDFDLEKECRSKYSELRPIEDSTSATDTKISRYHGDNSIIEIAFKLAGSENTNIKHEDHLRQTHNDKALGQNVINTALGQNVAVQPVYNINRSANKIITPSTSTSFLGNNLSCSNVCHKYPIPKPKRRLLTYRQTLQLRRIQAKQKQLKNTCSQIINKFKKPTKTSRCDYAKKSDPKEGETPKIDPLYFDALKVDSMNINIRDLSAVEFELVDDLDDQPKNKWIGVGIGNNCQEAAELNDTDSGSDRMEIKDTREAWSSDRPSSEDGLKLYSYRQALEYLEPLKDYAFRRENQEAIKIISNIEVHFSTCTTQIT